MLGGLGHGMERRWRAVQVKEKVEHAMARNVLRGQLTCLSRQAPGSSSSGPVKRLRSGVKFKG